MSWDPLCLKWAPLGDFMVPLQVGAGDLWFPSSSVVLRESGWSWAISAEIFADVWSCFEPRSGYTCVLVLPHVRAPTVTFLGWLLWRKDAGSNPK